mmetsp:Transcript_107911/g.344452  ORF Transcript_107911/g.344452 Transcript_107911/m.344452 type:complete len:460 (-) Transcript_107911:51-1430(-)
MAVLGPGLSAGDTAFMFLCTGMVQLMTPGLAFFYGGLVRSTHIITIMLQSYLSLGITFILWYVVLFSMSFGDTIGGVIGDPLQHFMFKNVTANKAFNEESATIPGVMFAGYQGMFAVIAPALMTGAFADRMRLPAYVAFKILWMFLVYAPVCHWVWGGGWMAQMGCYDFAGGIVVHITSAFSALASLNIVGNRHVPEDDLEFLAPHNVPFVALGTAMLWFGWFGFNGGSALGSKGLAIMAMMNSQLAGSVGMVGWMIMDILHGKKPGLVGACVGAVAGLATITPAAGFVDMNGAFLIGIMAAVLCYKCVHWIHNLGYDDALDVWGVHGMGGFSGSIIIGLLANPEINPGTATRSWEQLRVQTICSCVTAVYSYVVSYVMLKIMDCVIVIRPPRHHDAALDLVQHGEVAYVTHKSNEHLNPDGPYNASSDASSDDDSTEDPKRATNGETKHISQRIVRMA